MGSFIGGKGRSRKLRIRRSSLTEELTTSQFFKNISLFLPSFIHSFFFFFSFGLPGGAMISAYHQYSEDWLSGHSVLSLRVAPAYRTRCLALVGDLV